jgi:hypothetical protein
MRANIACHREASSGLPELNEPFAMYLPDQRVYLVHRNRDRLADGAIVVRDGVPSGAARVPGDIGVFEWDPARKDGRTRPALLLQWEFRVIGDKRTRSIVSQRGRILDHMYEATEELALFNTSANAYLVYDAKRNIVGWRNR